MRTVIIYICLFLIHVNLYSQNLHHKIKAGIDIPGHRIEVVDEITLPSEFLEASPELEFTLHAGLKVHSPDKKISIDEIPVESDNDTRVPLKTYRISKLDKGKNGLVISIAYSGIINDDIVTGAAEYARGFSETSGIISEKGIYLAGSTQWVPKFKNTDLFEFTLEVSIDPEWSIVSQGTRILNETKEGMKHIRYDSPEPMDEIQLIGGKWTEYSIPSEKVLFQAFLRTPDEKLANKYLGATQEFLSMYEKMIGPYPFTKFALVENFWETGYGMPSFTLLGPKVIRFPWILYSSYPHELLHNYWGNGVYVDYESGNWCEGITAYMADHLLKEQQGQGAAYRQSTLQKFTDYVNPDNDFPLTAFLSRNNSAEEAIGYGKCLMMNNMLRMAYGDELFLRSYSKFYNDNTFRKAGFQDIQKSFEAVTGDDLSMFFRQWTERKGAPSLELSDVKVIMSGTSYNLSFHIAQTQQEDAFDLDIPVYVYLEGASEVSETRLKMKSRTEDYQLSFSQKPVRIEIDPVFQLFRRLDRNEVPTTLTQLFGAKESLVILPSGSTASGQYKEMAAIWKATQEAQGNNMKIVYDNEIHELPDDMTVWILGFENALAGTVKMPQNYLEALQEEQQSLIGSLTAEGSLVYAIQNPGNKNLTLGFVATHNPNAVGGLGRKLPHYGKYSYLGFEGDAPDNVLKGVFPAMGSPLNYSIPYKGKIIQTSGKITPRKALIE